MSDSKTPGEGSLAPSEPKRSLTSADAIKQMQLKMYKEAAMRQADTNRGSKYRPMSIEPFPFERLRLSTEYTDADRALRKQWFQDQLLSEREPVYIEKLERRNFFRRVWNAPFNALEKTMQSMKSPPLATAFVRFTLPKLIGSMAVMYGLWYHTKYKGMPWECSTGIYAIRPQAFSGATMPGSEAWDKLVDGGLIREPSSFFDRGFKDRKVFLDSQSYVTSGSRD